MIPIRPGFVGGEPAQEILDLVRSFPLSLDFAGQIVVHNTATGEAAASLQRAYEQVEIAVLAKEERCPDKHQHLTLSEAQYRWMMLRELTVLARIAADDLDRVDPLWSLEPGWSPLHSGEWLQIRGNSPHPSAEA